MSARLVALFSLVLYLGFAPPSALASPEPSWSFRVLRSDHFELVYRDDQVALAKRYALAAEQAYALLLPIFKEAPDKTIVVLTDETDSSNGMATFLPYPSIYVYPVLPTTLDSIDEYGDWALEMMVHEYTHILNMYSSHGIYIPLKLLFGTVIRPNAVLPKWYLEGLAVNLESRLTDHGRLRSSETAASARAWSLGENGKSEGVPEMNEQELGTWPYGARPYLLGGWWWNQAQNQKGPGVIETWNQNFARRIPFLLNGPVREQTGQSVEEFWQTTQQELNRTAKADLASLNTGKRPLSTPLAEAGGEQSVFALSPNHEKLVYWNGLPQGQGSEVRLKVRSFPNEPFQNIRSTRLFKTSGTLRVHWLTDSQFVFDQLDLTRPRVTFRDLYLYDLNLKRVERLTDGMRAQEPSPSPKGDRIAFIQNEGGRNRLMVLNMDNRQSRVLLHGGFNQRLSGPEFLNDNELLFVLRQRSGLETIQVYNFTDRKIHLWNEDLKSAQNLRLTSKGVLVTDSGTHVRNVYLAGAGKTESQALSNTFTDIETVDFDEARNEILASELTPQGRRLMSWPYAPTSPITIDPPQLEAPPKVTVNKTKIREESFIPLAYLWPRYWIPMVYPVENGLLFQGTSSNADPIGRNRYSLFASLDTVTKKPSYGIDYVNSSLPTDIGLSLSKSVSYLGASGRTLESQVSAVNFSNYWPFNDRSTNWQVGAIQAVTDSPTTTYHRAGPTAGFRLAHLESPVLSWYGALFEANHEEFVGSGDNLAYGRTRLHLGQNLALGGGHSIHLETRAAFSPRLPVRNVIDLGERNVGGNYLVSLSNSDFLLRGYPSGNLVGRKLLNANLEYVLPVARTLGGWGTFPLFLRDLDLAIFGDAMSVDGGAYDPDLEAYLRTDLSHYFMGTGAELRLKTTAAYHLPVSFILGGYYGLNTHYQGGFSPFFGIGLGDLGALQNKTP